ncbi:MAG: FtsX-like permease family protein [Methyloglobulus sp.]|nr:FtsX-like permease family protein [Methyloglobulus sp.]
MKSMNLALRLLWRDIRAGELTLLFLALLIAVTCSTATTILSERLERTMTDKAADFMAADLVINSPYTLADDWLKKASRIGLSQSQTVEFSSVLIEHDALLLAGIKAVTDNYPLRGYLKTTSPDYSTETIEHEGPKPGQAWVDMRVLSALKLKLGDTVTVGEKQLQISKILSFEPDKHGDLYGLSPRVMMHQQDMVQSGIIQPGSHVHYFYQFKGDAKQLAEYKHWITPKLSLSQRLLGIHDDRPEIGSALSRAACYLGLTSITVIIISGVAIAMATRRFVERHLDATALMRCLGSKQSDVIKLFISQFLILGLLTGLVGFGLGWLAQALLFIMLRDLLPGTIANPGYLTVVSGMLTGLTVLIGFSLPPLLQLKHVPPARVLRRDITPMPTRAWLVYGFAVIIVGLMVWGYTQNVKMTLTIIGVGLMLLLLLVSIIYAILIFTRRIIPRFSLHWRFGLQALLRNTRATISQVLAFTITLVVMMLSFSIRNDLIENWQKQLPKDAPNHFAYNIFPEQKDDLKSDLEAQGIQGSRFFPIIQGRLTEINGVDVEKIVSKGSQGDALIHRELSLTYTKDLPIENTIAEGSWWTDNKPGLVSVMNILAESLKFKLGDRLRFVVNGQYLDVTVNSIRSSGRETMNPNFYMIFSPGTLNGFPEAFLTSFYLPEDKKMLLNQLAKKYPTVSILDVDVMLKQLKTIVAQLTEVINYLLCFALMSGFMVLFSALYSTLDNRIYESALLRTFGAKRSMLRFIHVIEFFALGLLSGLLAVIISECMLYLLSVKVLEMDYRPTYYLWYTLPAIAAVTVSLAGCWGVRRVTHTPLLKVLREA